MKTILIGVMLLVGVGFVQLETVDNGAWTRTQIDAVRFAVPADWVQLGAGRVADAEGDIRLDLDSTCPAEETLDAWAASAAEMLEVDETAQGLTQETLALPLGEAVQLTWETDAAGWNAAVYALASDACLTVRATAAEEASIFERILHTIAWRETLAEGSWLLQADPNLVVTLRTPPSWQKLPVENSLMVRDTFDDVLVQVQYRDLGGETNVEALQPQFDELYAERGFTVADLQIVNLPIGDVLLYRLESVQLGALNPQTQFQAAVMRGNYLILATLGADERYFDEYEQTLLQMLNTLTFDANRIP